MVPMSIKLRICIVLVVFSILSVLSSKSVFALNGWKEIYDIRQLPLPTEVDLFKKHLLEETMPPDDRLYDEIQRLESQTQTIKELESSKSRIAEIKENVELGFQREGKSTCYTDYTANEYADYLNSDFIRKVVAILESAARSVDQPYVPLALKAPNAEAGETCEKYRKRAILILNKIKPKILERLDQYSRIEQQKRQAIPSVLAAYNVRIEQLKKAMEASKKLSQQKSASTIAENLWVVVLALGVTAILILLIVRLFPEKSQLELIQSGQVIQFITVLLLLTVILGLGLTGIISENTLGTLLGGVAGYVLSQGVGRVAQHAASKQSSHNSAPDQQVRQDVQQ